MILLFTSNMFKKILGEGSSTSGMEGLASSHPSSMSPALYRWPGRRTFSSSSGQYSFNNINCGQSWYAQSGIRIYKI